MQGEVKIMVRLNYKKVFLFTSAVIFIFILFLMLKIPKNITLRKQSMHQLNEKVDKLQQRLENQLSESYGLLEQLQNIVDIKQKPSEEVQHNNDIGEDNVIHENLDKNQILPVLVISCNRVTVSRCLDNLIKYRPDKDMFPIIVSQDCNHTETYEVIKSYVTRDPSISVIRQPDQSMITLPKQKVKFRGYYKIARHYKFALNYVLKEKHYDAVIIVEDDLDISPDFFEYFRGTYPLLIKDPTLWCISAWNDNGKHDLIDESNPELLHRTDFFPGLGWMFRRNMWKTLEPVWPEAFFDDWLRDQKNTGGKACIRPEISRTYSFGKVGVSKGLFFDLHLKHIVLNSQYVEFSKLDLSYLIKDKYDDKISEVYQLDAKHASDVMLTSDTKPVRVPYHDAASFRIAAKTMGAMDDFRSGIPRTAYNGIVTLFLRGQRVYLTPDFIWTKYDPSWG